MKSYIKILCKSSKITRCTYFVQYEKLSIYISPSNLLIKLSGKKKKTLDFHGGVSQIFGPTLHAIIHGHQRHILLIRERHFYITEQNRALPPFHCTGTAQYQTCLKRISQTRYCGKFNKSQSLPE